MAKTEREALEREYQESTGHEPEEKFPLDHPDRWQWDYEGTKPERDGLLDRLEDDRGEQPTQDEALF